MAAGTPDTVAPTPGAGGEITVDAVAVEYRGARGVTPALSRTTATFAPGSFTTLIGASGCGKSTLLNVIAGFVTPTAGTVTLDGAPITRPGPDRTVVFQQYALLPWMSARQNVEFGLAHLPLTRAQRRDRALHALDEVRLAHAADSLPGELSGGMAQRVSIARALAGEPRVVLMDEPFGALDAITRAVMQELLVDLWRRTGLTVVFVTHDVDEALFLSQRILLLSARPGRIVTDIPLTGAGPEERTRIRAEVVGHLGGH